MLSSNQQVLFELVKAGLWEENVQLMAYQNIKWQEVYRLAVEQSVLGLVLAGLEHSDMKPPQVLLLQWIGEIQVIERRNKEMNAFIANLIENLRKNDVYVILLKGQGVAQCYEKPLWRSCGDVDLLLSYDNYHKAYEYLTPLATKVDGEKEYTKHQALTISGWEVELHGTLRSGLWGRLEQTVDEVQNAVFYGGCVRSWQNGKTQVFLPDVNEDVFFVFSHILQHFFKGGIGLRQICDWCRLLWKYQRTLNYNLLEKRLRGAGVMSEWKVFGSMVVNMLGLPVEAMPFYSSNIKWKKKADRVLGYILETGNFGHNRDVSYQKNTPVLLRKLITMWRQTKDNAVHFLIFPKDSIKAWWSIFVAGIKGAVRGK